MKRLMFEVLPEDFVTIRKEILNVSQSGMAKLLGVSTASVQKYEQGGAIPSYEVLVKMGELANADFTISPQNIHPLLTKKQAKN
jgi:predicted transcriptional regulator